MYMSQLNMHTSPSFEEDLERLMQLREIPTKSAAIRTAVREALARALRARGQQIDFRDWIGRGLQAEGNRRPRFSSDDELWQVTEDEG